MDLSGFIVLLLQENSACADVAVIKMHSMFASEPLLQSMMFPGTMMHSSFLLSSGFPVLRQLPVVS